MPITIYVRKSPEGLRQFLGKLPLEIRAGATREAAEYLLGDDSRGLRHYANYKYVSRKSAGLKTSAAQIRFFFATGILKRFSGGAIGLIKYVRENTIKQGWVIFGTGTNVRLSNKARGAKWVVGPQQARQPAKVGHRKASDVVATNVKGAIRAVKQFINRAIKKGK
jgi:hypothetical protein